MPKLPVAALLLFSPLAACGGGDDGALPDAGFNCEQDGRGEAFTVGMSHTGANGMEFRLLSSNPAPPARSDNTWVLELRDDAGAPIDDAPIEVTPFMPDHRHGTPIEAVSTPDPDVDGRYTIEPVNLFMPGVWEVTIEATKPGVTPVEKDEVVFTFCVSS